MPKIGFGIKDAVETSVGIQEGNVEIVEAKCKIHQFQPNKRGEQSSQFTAVALKFHKLDKEFERLSGDEDEVTNWVYFSLGGKSLDRFHPGQATGPDDNDPDDLGDEIDTEGNVIYPVEGAKLNTKCKWIMFTKILEQGIDGKGGGFRPSVLGDGFLPALIGTKGHVLTIKLPKIDETGAEPTCLVFDKIVQFPYEKKAKSASKAPVAVPKKTAAAKPAPVEEEQEETAADTESAESAPGHDEALSALVEVAATYQGQTISKSKLFTAAITKLVGAKVNGTLQKAAQGLIKDGDWLFERAKEMEFVVDGDKVIFPKA